VGRRNIYSRDSINTGVHESTPFIAPDGKYIIFSRAVKTSGYDQHDLYISYNKKRQGLDKGPKFRQSD